jgi:hypothetical protein
MPQALIAKLVGVAFLCGLFMWVGYAWRDSEAEAEIAHLVATHSEARSKQMAEFARANAEYRRREAETNKRMTETLNAAHAQLVTALDDARSARSASERLQLRVAALTAARCPSAAHDSEPALAGPPAEAAGYLLADLFSRLDAAAGELGEYADRARIAGTACERAYDALTP